jgi:hypothetical protein
LATSVAQSCREIGVPSAWSGADRLGAQHSGRGKPALLNHLSKSAGELRWERRSPRTINREMKISAFTLICPMTLATWT